MEQEGKKMGSVAAAMAAGVTALALTLGAAQPAQALQSLVPGSQETSGDKLFTLTSCTYQMAVCTADVGEFFGVVQNGLFGVTITGPNASTLLPQGTDQDISLEFLVSTTSGLARITDVQLIVAGPAGSQGSVGETIKDGADPGLTYGQFNVVLPDTTNTFVLPMPPAPLVSIRIDKDINAVNGQIDSVTQLISQVPVPGSLALLATGLLGFALRRHRA